MHMICRKRFIKDPPRFFNTHAMANSTPSVANVNFVMNIVGDYQAEDMLRHEEANTIIQGEVTKYMAPIGLLMNGIFLYVVVRIKSMHSIVNVYLGSLSVADSIILVCSLLSMWRKRGEAFDVTLVLLSSFGTLASYFFVVALAFERYFAICRPLVFRATAGKCRAIKISAVLWITVVIVGCGATALYQWGGDLGNDIANVTASIYYTFGLVITTTLYGRIVKKLRQQPRITSSGDEQQRLQRVIAMLVVNTALFFAFNITSIIETIMFAVIRWSTLPDSSLIKLNHSWIDFFLVVFILSLLSCSIDPLVYSGVNSDYRAALVEALPFLNPKRCCCPSSQDITETQIALQEIRPNLRHPTAPSKPTQDKRIVRQVNKSSDQQEIP